MKEVKGLENVRLLTVRKPFKMVYWEPLSWQVVLLSQLTKSHFTLIKQGVLNL